MLDKHITRLVKSANGDARFETLTDVADVIKLAGRGGAFNLEEEFGISAERVAALDRVTQLAIAAGIDALRDAGIPLVMRYKTTTKGTQLPERWGLPDALRDDTGVIFASAFPGYDSFADEMARYYADHERREQLAMLESLLARAVEGERTFQSGAGDQPAHRRIARHHRQRTVCLRPALLAPRPVHGTFAVCRIHRRPRSQHSNQRSLREHYASGGAGGGLDSCRALQPGDRGLGRRRHLRSSDRLDGRRLPGHVERQPPTKWSQTPPFLSTAAGTA